MERLARDADVSAREAKQVFDAIFDANPGKGIIASELRAGRQVYLRGFGTFGVERRAGGQAMDPKSGKMINVPPLTIPRFVPDSQLLARVNPKNQELRKVREAARSKKDMDIDGLAREVSKTTGLALDRVRRLVGLIFSTKPGAGIIAIELDGGRTLEIPDFGTFVVEDRAKRQGNNARTGQSITVPHSKTVSFKPAPKFKDSL